uniref:Vesicle transport protein n=1 Tax=Acrobeloides nanus TaxID=290746 RepID=A0A914C2X8_9BILA
MFDRVRRNFGSLDSNEVPQTDNDVNNDITDINNLSWELRIWSFSLAFILSMGTPLLFAGKLTGFSVMVSLGSIISMLGTCFLMGPWKQLKKMFEPTRLIATIVYISMIVFTLIAGLVLKNGVLALIFIICQYIAMAWYSLSYIPYARDMVAGCFGKCIG